MPLAGVTILLRSALVALPRATAPMPVDYLKKILTARVYDVAIESPLELAPTLSARLGNRVLLKREDQQPVFSFKLRGAYNKMVHLSAAQRSRGVIAASAGNHAQGVALAAQKLGCQATIVMPVTTPDDQDRGGRGTRREGDCCTATRTATPTRVRIALARSARAVFVHPSTTPT